MKTAAKISYVEKTKDGTVILHGFKELVEKGKVILKTKFSRIIFDSNVDRFSGKAGTYLAEVGKDGVIGDQRAVSIIEKNLSNRKTAFVRVQIGNVPLFYVESPTELPNNFDEQVSNGLVSLLS